MMVIARLLASLGLALGLSQCAISGLGGGGGTTTRNVVYTPETWPASIHANLYQPPGKIWNEASPAVVLIHGGGLKFKDLRWQMGGIARKLAARGYFVMNVTYRHPPGWTYPAPMDDIRAAVDWLVENAAAQGIDPERIATFGYSAGGHLALLNGFQDKRIKAIVAGAAPSDLMLFEGGRLVRDFIGGTRREQPDRYRSASPVFQVGEDSPPVFLYHGSRDEMVPPIHAWLMKSELDAAGVPNELHWLEDRGHVGAFLRGGEAERRAIDFLDRVLK